MLLLSYAVTPAPASMAIVNLGRPVLVRVALMRVKQFAIAWDRSHFGKACL